MLAGQYGAIGAEIASIDKNIMILHRGCEASRRLAEIPGIGPIGATILVLNGADDPFVKREQYDPLKKHFDAAKADYRIIEYRGAVHAFTNPEATELGKKFNLPLRYDAKVDQEAKAEAAKFFAADLQK